MSTTNPLRPQQLPRNRTTPKRPPPRNRSGKLRRIREPHTGVMQPEYLYNREALKADFGINEDHLIDAKKSGIVKPRYMGQEVLYWGRELIEWVLKMWPTKTPFGSAGTFRKIEKDEE